MAQQMEHIRLSLKELAPENVRWYFVTHKSKNDVVFEPFCAHDSLALEKKYREIGPGPRDEAIDKHSPFSNPNFVIMVGVPRQDVMSY